MVERAVSIQIFTEKIQFCHMLKLIMKQLASIEKSRNDSILSTHVTEATIRNSSIISSLIFHPSILFVFSSIKVFAQIFTTLKKNSSLSLVSLQIALPTNPLLPFLRKLFFRVKEYLNFPSCYLLFLSLQQFGVHPYCSTRTALSTVTNNCIIAKSNVPFSVLICCI